MLNYIKWCIAKNSQTDWFDRKTEINHAFTLNVENKQRTERLKQTRNVNLAHILSTYNLGIYNIHWFYSSRSYKLTLAAAYRFHLTTVKKRVPECSEEPFPASGREFVSVLRNLPLRHEGNS